VIGQLVLGQANSDDVEGFAELLHSGVEIDIVEADFDRRDAATHSVEKPPAAHLVEHADLINQPKRMIERQEVDHRPEAQLPGPLRDGRQENAG